MKPEDLGCTLYTTQYKKRMNLDIIELEELGREKRGKREKRRIKETKCTKNLNVFFSLFFFVS